MTSHDRTGAEAPFAEDDERQMLDVIERWLEREVRPNVLEHAEPLSAREISRSSIPELMRTLHWTVHLARPSNR